MAEGPMISEAISSNFKKKRNKEICQLTTMSLITFLHQVMKQNY